MEDISFKIGEHNFNYRVAAIVEHNQRYLLMTGTDLDFWFLPGGRVKVGESSLVAIKRELHEELGLDNQAVWLRWTVENFFTFDHEDFHEMSFYFTTLLPPGHPFIQKESFQREPDFEFRWFDFGAIQALNLHPQFLKSELALAQQGFKHIIFTDGEEPRYVDV